MHIGELNMKSHMTQGCESSSRDHSTNARGKERRRCEPKVNFLCDQAPFLPASVLQMLSAHGQFLTPYDPI
jgi:hypothetical protein